MSYTLQYPFFIYLFTYIYISKDPNYLYRPIIQEKKKEEKKMFIWPVRSLFIATHTQTDTHTHTQGR